MSRLSLASGGCALALVLTSVIGHGSATSALASPPATTASRALVHRISVGAYVQGMQANPALLGSFERLVGAHMDIASYYYGYGDVFPGRTELTFARGGTRKVLVSWDMGHTRFTDWTSGSRDDYLDRIAAAARAYPYPLYVRPWPEMNGDWQTFQPTATGDRPDGGTYAQFRAAWRYVVGYLRARGATNLRWVFNPTADTYAGTTPVRSIWPGTSYVDVLGLDGFNWGTSATGLQWRTFRGIFGAQYGVLTRLHPTAPVWICETGSKEPRRSDGAPVDRGHDKARWVRALFDYVGMPRVRAVVWFDARKERDWRVNSSRASLRAFRESLRSAR